MFTFVTTNVLSFNLCYTFICCNLVSFFPFDLYRYWELSVRTHKVNHTLPTMLMFIKDLYIIHYEIISCQVQCLEIVFCDITVCTSILDFLVLIYYYLYVILTCIILALWLIVITVKQPKRRRKNPLLHPLLSFFSTFCLYFCWTEAPYGSGTDNKE